MFDDKINVYITHIANTIEQQYLWTFWSYVMVHKTIISNREHHVSDELLHVNNSRFVHWSWLLMISYNQPRNACHQWSNNDTVHLVSCVCHTILNVRSVQVAIQQCYELWNSLSLNVTSRSSIRVLKFQNQTESLNSLEDCTNDTFQVIRLQV